MEAKDMILICKALSDTNRLEIVQMLSDGEKCGCKILDKFRNLMLRVSDELH